MRTVYALAPWEYPGADFDPNPHAFTRHVFAGKERNLWLKMRRGVIYFGEVEHARTYAVTRLFNDAIAADAERLIAAWRSEVERESYGAFLVIRQHFSHSFAVGSFCLILRADGSNWIKEHFDEEWQQFSSPLTQPFLFWSRDPLGKTGASVVQKLQSQFLNRTVNSAHFQSVEPHWTGDAQDIVSVGRSAAQLWLLPAMGVWWGTKSRAHWKYKSNDLAFNVEIQTPFPDRQWSQQFDRVQELLKWHNAFVGVEWKQATKDENYARQIKTKPRKYWLRSLDKWGEDWRGNFVGRQYTHNFSEPPISVTSQHDKLEAALILREFLRDKLPAEQIKAMLQDALKN